MFDLSKIFTLLDFLLHKMLDLSKIFEGLFYDLSGGLGARPAQREVVKMKKKKFPTGLQVHLEDMS